MHRYNTHYYNSKRHSIVLWLPLKKQYINLHIYMFFFQVAVSKDSHSARLRTTIKQEKSKGQGHRSISDARLNTEMRVGPTFQPFTNLLPSFFTRHKFNREKGTSLKVLHLVLTYFSCGMCTQDICSSWYLTWKIEWNVHCFVLCGSIFYFVNKI